jgi:GNAT superfamily N-acetyltransferase
MDQRMKTSIATQADIPEMIRLINSAYRATEGVKGWTYEGHLIDGPRTDREHIEELLSSKDSVILLCTDADQLIGSVHLEKQGDLIYLGMLSVDPLVQNKGVGKFILNAAREYALDKGCSEIKITVISVRHELIAWYERCGFEKTGEKLPFHEVESFGKQKTPLELVVMKRMIR